MGRSAHMNPLVSVIIPCWNVGDYVGAAIESAFAQTYPNIEIIVVDDGSTDNSLDVIRSFGDRVRWKSIPHAGVSSARNHGLALARGELVQFLDADDLLRPFKLERQIAAWSGEDIVFCRGSSLDLKGKEMPRPPIVDADVFRIAALGPITSLGPIIRKMAAEAVGGFCTELPRVELKDFYLRLAIANASWVYVDEDLFKVRRRPGSLSSDSKAVADAYEAVGHGTYLRLKASGELDDHRAAALSEVMLMGARIYMRAHCMRGVAKYVGLAAAMHPDKLSILDSCFEFLPRRRRFLYHLFGPVAAEIILEKLRAVPMYIILRRMFLSINNPLRALLR